MRQIVDSDWSPDIFIISIIVCTRVELKIRYCHLYVYSLTITKDLMCYILNLWCVFQISQIFDPKSSDSRGGLKVIESYCDNFA